jgi:hypothetical protein
MSQGHNTLLTEAQMRDEFENMRDSLHRWFSSTHTLEVG